MTELPQDVILADIETAVFESVCAERDAGIQALIPDDDTLIAQYCLDEVFNLENPGPSPADVASCETAVADCIAAHEALSEDDRTEVLAWFRGDFSFHCNDTHRECSGRTGAEITASWDAREAWVTTMLDDTCGAAVERGASVDADRVIRLCF